MEVSCTEICACTPCNTCTVIFQAVLGLLHICCKNSLTTCSKPKCAEMICVFTGATCLGFLGVHVAKIFILHPDKMFWKRAWMGASRGKIALAWWDLLLISIRRRYNLISRTICLLTSDYPHVPSNIQNAALRWGHGPPQGTQDWQCQFHRLLVNNTICWMDHCLERDGRTWHLTMTCETYFHTYLWIGKGLCIKKWFGEVTSCPPLPHFCDTSY